jgi:hypothetical protein
MHRVRSLGLGGRLLLALAVGGAVFGIASAVQASIPSSGGVIHGCYGKPGTPQKGQLRVRDADQGEQCRVYENQVDWNATGVSGATGPTGPTGPTGASGPGQTAPFAGTLINGSGPDLFWLAFGAGAISDAYHSNATDITWLGPMSAAGTTGNLIADLAGQHPGAGNSFQFFITVNGNPTPVTCTIADLQTSCSDTTHTASYSVGQYLGIAFSAATSVSPSNPYVSASFSAG